VLVGTGVGVTCRRGVKVSAMLSPMLITTIKLTIAKMMLVR
jgi:hypothetical protein